MICRNCGATMGDFDTYCPNCGASNAANNYEAVNTTYTSQPTEQPMKITGLLVFSIIELCCVSPIFGLIALILWIAKLKPAVDNGNIDQALQTKKTIKILLWVGLILSIVFPLLIIMLIAIPNFSGVQSRMVIRADKATAAQIGKATRIWYTDATTDPSYRFDVEEVENGFVRLDEVDGLEGYVATYQEPASYKVGRNQEDGAYYVTVINEGTPYAKIAVAIGPENIYSAPRGDSNINEVFYEDLDYAIDNYDGIGSGIAYIEP